MVASVPRRPATLSRSGVVSAATVPGSTWSAIGSQANHILGGPHTLIPAFMPDRTVTVGTSETLRLTVWPRYQASHRKWIFYAATTSDFALLTVSLPNGQSFAYRASSDTPEVMEFTENRIGFQSALEQNADIIVSSAAASSKDAVIYMLGCYELRRGELQTGQSDQGLALESVRSGQPIFDNDTEGLSVGYAVEQVDAVVETARRCGLFYATPFYTTTSAVFANVLQAQPVVLGRKRYAGDTKARMELRFYATAAAGSVGEIRATMASGAVATWEIPSGFAGRVRGSILIDCDDFTSTYGRQGSLDDTCTIAVRRVSGAGNVVLETISGGEASNALDPIQALRGPSAPGHVLRRQRRPRGRSWRQNQ